jgi:hypothetical protein
VSADVWAVPFAPVIVSNTLADALPHNGPDILAYTLPHDGTNKLADTHPHNVPDGISDTYDGGAERLTDGAAYGGAHSI